MIRSVFRLFALVAAVGMILGHLSTPGHAYGESVSALLPAAGIERGADMDRLFDDISVDRQQPSLGNSADTSKPDGRCCRAMMGCGADCSIAEPSVGARDLTGRAAGPPLSDRHEPGAPDMPLYRPPIS
ncbi:MAG: hypothetical protein AAGF59_12100 [Pseudomonadota bacterium]